MSARVDFMETLWSNVQGELDVVQRLGLFNTEVVPRIVILVCVVVSYIVHIKSKSPGFRYLLRLSTYSLANGFAKQTLLAYRGLLFYFVLTFIITFDVYNLVLIPLLSMSLLGFMPTILHWAVAGSLGYLLPYLSFKHGGRYGMTVEGSGLSVLIPRKLFWLANNTSSSLLNIEQDIGKELECVYGVARINDFILGLPDSERTRLQRKYGGKQQYCVLKRRNDGGRLKILLELFGPAGLHRRLDRSLPSDLIDGAYRPSLRACAKAIERSYRPDHVRDLYRLNKAAIIDGRKAAITASLRRLSREIGREFEPEENARISREFVESLEMNEEFPLISTQVMVLEFGYVEVLTALNEMRKDETDRAIPVLTPMHARRAAPEPADTQEGEDEAEA